MYCCQYCPEKHRYILAFHDHMLMVHHPEDAFCCSACSFRSNKRDGVSVHIGRQHNTPDSFPLSSAQVFRVLPIPSHRYADCLQPVGTGGQLLSEGSSVKGGPQPIRTLFLDPLTSNPNCMYCRNHFSMKNHQSIHCIIALFQF